MKKIGLTFFCCFFVFIVKAQIADYNHFPTMQPQHILDERLANISFAFSMRVLVSDYNSALIRLRRDSDNQLRNFTFAANDIVDVAAIDAWRAGSNVFVHTWYDQSGLGRNAVQANNANQPRFFTNNPNQPFFQGDAANDVLIVNTPNGMQDLLINGTQGSILVVMAVTRRSQVSFGAMPGSNRWSVHGNWGDNRFYFDPGFCCNVTADRSFNNAANVGIMNLYTLIKQNNRAIARLRGVTMFDAPHTRAGLAGNFDFNICAGADDNATSSYYSDTSFIEMIMYNTVNPASQEIEQNTITFWNL